MMVFLVICIYSFLIFFQMQYKTLKELLSTKTGDSAPYPTTMVKVCIIKVGHIATFTSSNGEKGQMLNFSVADGTEAMTATLSDETKFSQIREGRSLTLRNFLIKGTRLVLSKQTKIMAGQMVTVPKELSIKGTSLITPQSPQKTLKEILDAPVKSIWTVQGEVVKVSINVCLRD